MPRPTTYAYLRLFLTARAAPAQLELLGAAPVQDETRQAYLLRVLGGAPMTFRHRARPFAYRTFGNLEGVLCSAIGRERVEDVNAPVEQAFAPGQSRFWRTANVYIDTTGDADGQKVAFQVRSDVGTPLSIMRTFVDDINRREVRAKWQIAVNPISKEAEFWQSMEENRGTITEVRLTFVPPNIWGARNATDAALRELNQQNNVTEVDVKLKNPDAAIQPDSERVRESVEYVTQGGGTLEAKSGRKIIYSTERDIETKTVEEDKPVQSSNEAHWREIIRRLFGR